MKNEIQMVRDFHLKYDLSPRSQMGDTMLENPNLGVIHTEVTLFDAAKLAKKLEEKISEDPRYLRAHLILEEAVETCFALLDGEELEALDGCADLCYVIFGTAATFGWDLEGAFHEVHRSNMTKTRKSDDPGRCRDKGETFQPPILGKFLNEDSN